MNQPAACRQADISAAMFDPALPCPAGLFAWNGSDPAARLAVYRNNVIASLVDALAESFPVVQELVGKEFFRAMAAVFVRQTPPRTRVLAHYGDPEFARFVGGFEPAASLPYLAGVACLEAARARAYHARDAKPLDVAALRDALESGERAGELRLVCHPSLQVVESRFAVVSLWAAHQGVGDIATIDVAAPEAALVVRPSLDVLVLRAPPGVARFVAALKEGSVLADAACTAANQARGFDLPATLALLAGHGAFSAIQVPTP